MYKCKFSIGLMSEEHTGRKKYVPCITNSNNFISSVNKSATRSSDEQIRKHQYCWYLTLSEFSEEEVKMKVTKSSTEKE